LFRVEEAVTKGISSGEMDRTGLVKTEHSFYI